MSVRTFLLFILIVGLSAVVSPPSFGSLTLDIGGYDFSADSGGTGTLGGTGKDLSFGTVVMQFTDVGAGMVQVAINFVGGNANSGALIHEVSFNNSLNLTGDVSVDWVSGQRIKTDPPSPPVYSLNGFSTDASTGYDFQFEYGGSNGKLDYGESSVYKITSSVAVFNAASFNSLNTDTTANKQWLAAVHMGQTDGNDNSGHYGGIERTVVPEPATLAVWSLLGLCAVGGIAAKGHSRQR